MWWKIAKHILSGDREETQQRYLLTPSERYILQI